MELTVTLTGLDALLRTLTHELPEAVQAQMLRASLQAAGEPIRVAMAQLAPRGPDAPHLAESMVTRPLGLRELEEHDASAGVEIGPTTAFFYGYFWEFGTVRLPARPFARPAFDAGRGEALAILEARLGAALLAAAGTPTP